MRTEPTQIELRNICYQLITELILYIEVPDLSTDSKRISYWVLSDAYITQYQLRFGEDEWLNQFEIEYIKPLNKLINSYPILIYYN